MGCTKEPRQRQRSSGLWVLVCLLSSTVYILNKTCQSVFVRQGADLWFHIFPPDHLRLHSPSGRKGALLLEQPSELAAINSFTVKLINALFVGNTPAVSCTRPTETIG